MPPVAKSKRRNQELEADEAALADFEEKIPVVKAPADKKVRNEVPTSEVVNIMADEIQELYRMTGSSLDDTNAQDKALILWRELMTHGVHARDKAVPHALCEEHTDG